MNQDRQRPRVIEQFRKNGKVARNWALRNFISRLGAYVADLKEEGWRIARAPQGGDYVYYLVWKPGMAQEVSWPTHVASTFIRNDDGSVFYGK